MKIFRLLFIFLISIKSFPQEIISVEYNQIYNTDFPTIGTGILQIFDNKSIYIDMVNTYRDYVKSNETSQSYFDSFEAKHPDAANGEKITLTFGANYDYYYYINDHLNNKFTFTGELSRKLYLIEEDFLLDWKISDETKMISGNKAYKAETFFRGRKWIAWFCPDLPYSYGPWKLHGLPGLIIQASDETLRYNYIAIKVSNNKEGIVFDCKKCQGIDIVSFIKKKFEANNNFIYVPDRDVTVVSLEVKNNAKELKYEWEE